MAAKLAYPVGFEPTTIHLEGGCSILLSYGHTDSNRLANELRFHQTSFVCLHVGPTVSLAFSQGLFYIKVIRGNPELHCSDENPDFDDHIASVSWWAGVDSNHQSPTGFTRKIDVLANLNYPPRKVVVNHIRHYPVADGALLNIIRFMFYIVPQTILFLNNSENFYQAPNQQPHP